MNLHNFQNTTIELIIPHIAKKNELLKINLAYIQKNIQPKTIYILTKKETMNELQYLQTKTIQIIDEDTIIKNLTLKNVENLLKKYYLPIESAGWYFQQFLKLAWGLKKNSTEYYISWDSDTIPIRPITFFCKEGKPLFTKKTEYNIAYFETIYHLLNLKKITDFSFIAENMIFNSSIIKKLIGEVEKNEKIKGKTFYEKIIAAVSQSSNPIRGFSEFETYGTYVMTYFPTMYNLKESKGFRNGAKFFGTHPSKADLMRFSQKYEIVSFEHWYKTHYWFILLQKLYSIIYYIVKKTVNFINIGKNNEKYYLH